MRSFKQQELCTEKLNYRFPPWIEVFSTRMANNPGAGLEIIKRGDD